MHQRASSAATAGTRTARRWAWLAGLVAGVAGLGLANLAAWLTGPAGSPVSAVGELIIAHLPAALVNFGKDTLGTADKPILLVIITAGVLVLCALAGQAEYRRRLGGAAVFALVAVIGLLAVGTRANGELTAFLPTVIGMVFGYLLLRSLVERLALWRSPSTRTAEAGPRSVERRSFLRWTAVAGGLAVVAAVAGQALVSAANRVSAAREAIRLPATTKPAPVPAGADFGIEGLSPYLTANDDFYRIDTALQVPVIDPADWSLSITGMVETPVTISYAELTALPLVEHVTTLTCVSNTVGGDLIGNARWLGYPIRDLLARAKPTAGADMVLSTSQDGFTAGSPLSALTDPDREALLAVGMNGDPLPLEHGFPVRMVVPGLYGYVSATKWVTQLKVTTFAADQGYWTPLGWSAKGPVKLASRIDVPRRKVSAGPVVVAGVAWAQHDGISRVEVGVDGEWHEAQLAEVTSTDTWRQWKYDWMAMSGDHTLTVRAYDTEGNLQIAAEAPPAPDGATGYHSLKVSV
ncbi:molybdopterin-dependent oxidoreductase [uncultured Friedmanniella sp.]|uniref:molybdopterin-dependent oxidoreductase n=1 Tax=uncultured Friedmanniella sp. TaxID=335381 RepID=UPI0035CAC087